jgi:hypothetical protein
MKLVGAGQQQMRHPLFDASGTITTGGTPQLVLARAQSRSFLAIQNNSSAGLLFEFGSARATCTISGGAVSGFTITNSGFNFTKPPLVRFMGGGAPPGTNNYLGLNQPNGYAPSNPATAIATLSGGSVNAITLTNPGSGYVCAPFVFLANSDLDPYGCATPSATVGILLPTASGAYMFNGTCCPTDSISVYGGTTGQAFSVKWMT